MQSLLSAIVAVAFWATGCAEAEKRRTAGIGESVEALRSSTRASLVAKFGAAKGSSFDLGYITPELLANVRNAKHKKVERNAAGSWCFYGHHLIITGDHNQTFIWQNSNKENGCDRPTDQCYGTNFWQADIREWEPDTCPNDTQGAGSLAFHGR